MTFTGDFVAVLQGFEIHSGQAISGDAGDNLLDFSGATSTAVNPSFLGTAGDDEMRDFDFANSSMNGGGDDDKLFGQDGNDQLFGDGGLDTLFGGAGADTLTGGGQSDRLDGGAGDDTLNLTGTARGTGGADNDLVKLGTLNVANNTAAGGPGNDTLEIGGAVSFFATLFDAADLGFEALRPLMGIVASGGIPHRFDFSGVALAAGSTGAAISGDSVNDTLTATVGNDTVSGGGGDDVLNGAAGNDSLFGGGNNDKFTDVLGNNLINGETGIDTISFAAAAGPITLDLSNTGAQATGVGTDTISNVENAVGSASADILTGNSGANRLTGGQGGDTLTGGGDVDTFVLERLSDSRNSAPDLITDLTNADVIDLHFIDADVSKPGNQMFKLVGNLNGNEGQAALKYDSATDRTKLLLDVDGDAKADATVLIAGDHDDFTNFVF